MQYASRILEAYEDEVAGAAYFDSLALTYPLRSAFLERCAALERATASQLSALLRKYQLTPRAQTTLEESGVLDAHLETGCDWTQLMQKSVKLYARYVAEFEALELIGPPEDQPILAALTAHEVQLIEWMQAETEDAVP